MTDQPHTPYITAVIEALTAAGLEPTGWWHSDLDGNPYGEGEMLNALLTWDGGHPAASGRVADRGMILLWEHPAEAWQYARRRSGGGNEEPQVIPSLPLWANPTGVVEIVRQLLSEGPVPTDAHLRWNRHAEMQAAVDAWEAGQ